MGMIANTEAYKQLHYTPSANFTHPNANSNDPATMQSEHVKIDAGDAASAMAN